MNIMYSILTLLPHFMFSFQCIKSSEQDQMTRSKFRQVFLLLAFFIKIVMSGTPKYVINLISNKKFQFIHAIFRYVYPPTSPTRHQLISGKFIY